MNAAILPQHLREKADMIICDDFQWYVSPHLWTNLAADAGVTAPAVGDSAFGLLSGATGATDNNEIAFRTTNELFLMAAGHPMWCYGRLQYAEANVDDANVAFGFANAIGANLLVDDGAGVKTTGNYALIYKVDGETKWRARSRNSTQTTDNQSLATAGGSAFQEFEIRIEEFSSLQCSISYLVDGLYLRDSTTGDIIVHRLDYASATEMNLGGYLKAGGANSETLVADLVAAGHVR